MFAFLRYLLLSLKNWELIKSIHYFSESRKFPKVLRRMDGRGYAISSQRSTPLVRRSSGLGTSLPVPATACS